MTAHPEHDRVVELLGAYALDAVDPEEKWLVERHLAECPRCRSEVDDVRQVAADLAITSGLESEQPPPAIWDRVAAGIAASEARARDLPGGPSGEASRRPADHSSGSQHRYHRLAWLGGAVAGAAAAVIAALAIGLVHTESQVHRLQSALAGQGSQLAVGAALASPGHQVVELRSGDGAQLAEVVVQHNGVGYFVRSTMTELPSSQTYQLWASINGRLISLGLLGRQPASGAAFSLGSSAAGARELMVTVEPAGGVARPDRAPIATAPVALS